MNVLSLFDGMSCGRIALDRLGVKVDNYFASEVKKQAIKVSKANWTDITHIGDVTKVTYSDGILYTEVGEFNVGKIDLLIGGSPCQDFSLSRIISPNFSSGSVGLSGDKSSLFYEYLRIMRSILEENPKLHWLLENVKMRASCKEELDTHLGVEGLLINSNTVSYQNRPRYYWSNLELSVPNDTGASFQDHKGTALLHPLSYYKVNRTPSREKMWANGKGRNSASFGCANVTNSDKIQCLTGKQDRCPNSGLVEYEDFCRYLTQEELEIAQTVPVGYTSCLSYNQAADVLGNGWTVDVIVHILKGMLK